MGCSGERRKKIKRHEEFGRPQSKAYLQCRVGIFRLVAGITNQKGEQSYMESIMNMKKTFALWLLEASLVAGIAIAGFAQNPMTTPNGNSGPATADQRAPKVTWLAGCLERGPGADQYTLHGPRFAMVGPLKSDSFHLQAFLDTEVRVAVVKSTESDGTLTVTDLILMSPSCASR